MTEIINAVVIGEERIYDRRARAAEMLYNLRIKMRDATRSTARFMFRHTFVQTLVLVCLSFLVSYFATKLLLITLLAIGVIQIPWLFVLILLVWIVTLFNVMNWFGQFFVHTLAQATR